MTQNCWEFKKCGRNPGGNKVAEFGLCPASVDRSGDGINEGQNGGRICWAITGTFCGGKVQGTFAQKKMSCITCDFFKEVTLQEKAVGKFTMVKPQSKGLGVAAKTASPVR